MQSYHSWQRGVIALVLGCLFGGCAKISVYRADASGNPSKDATGIPIYLPQPYILVSPPAEAGKPAVVEVITLPDPANRYFVKQTGWIGTTKATFTLKNGAIDTWNTESDSKTSETITALTGGYSQILTALKSGTPASGSSSDTVSSLARNPRGDPILQERRNQGQLLKVLAASLPGLVKPAVDKGTLTPDLARLAVAISHRLGQWGQLLVETGDEPSAQIAMIGIDAEKPRLETLRPTAVDDVSHKVRLAIDRFGESSSAIRTAIATTLEVPPAELPKLYRIKWENGKPTLERVEISTFSGARSS